jgi:MEMO1 family protein
MSLAYIAFVPHPPIIVPEVGKNNVSATKRTVLAMKKIGDNFNRLDIDTAILISPHTQISSFALTICTPDFYSGDFRQFAAPETKLDFRSDLQLSEEILCQLEKEAFPFEIDKQGFLDHGALVPLYWIKKMTDYQFELVEIGFSGLDNDFHIKFGSLLATIAKKSKKRIALIFSGDLSHRHFDNDLVSFARKFDLTIKKELLLGKMDKIVEIDQKLVSMAGECGFRSLLIMAGALQNEKAKIQLYSYEAPLGVGYLVADVSFGH